MNTKDVIYLICRLFGLYIVYNLLFTMSFAINALLNMQYLENIKMIQILLPNVILILFSIIGFIVFWQKAEWLSSKILGKYDNKEIKTTLNIEGLLIVGCIFMGISILMRSIPDIAGVIATDIINSRSVNIGSVTEDITRIIIGIFLVLGSNGILRIIKTFRNWN